MRQRILNITVDDLSRAELLERFDSGVLVTPNVDILLTLQEDKDFYDAFLKAEYVSVDSQIVFWAMKWLKRGVKEKISGSDFLPAFCDFHAQRNQQSEVPTRLFILGGKPGVAAAAMTRINQRVGAEFVIGSHSPSMVFVTSAEECRSVIDLINASGANALAIGLGSPKQEVWITRYRAMMPGIKRFMAVGAAIDFEAQSVNRAPVWMSNAGLEWFFRLCTEPRRLWRRYIIRGPKFFWLLLIDKLNLYKNPLRVS
jgi:N-acetylglucosaminyldiphosphoundecaprenol N-acetyl-beta-D-mannosaminyltransferase